MGYKDHSSNLNIGPRRITVFLDAESHTMGYKDHSSNPDICPRRIAVLLDVESHAMGYKDHSSNPDIRPRRITVLDHFPFGHHCELRENACPVPISPLWLLL
jgi:hypothetical protein